MNYPVWELTSFGGGLLVALIAVFHVTIAHFAVGGGLFLVLSEKKALRENSQALLDYTRRHARFFMLLTMVAGGVTGVGIWFIIALLHPSGTSVLIHTFVFGWATEWVCFLAEIVALFIYAYKFDTMERKSHVIVGWLYFLFAWLSLVLITGIINFMLTPGQWSVDHSFWSGFLNEGFLPGVFFRSFLAFTLAGLFGLLTASFIKDDQARDTMVRYCAKWVSLPIIGLAFAGWWYFSILPGAVQGMISGQAPEIIPFMKAFLWLAPTLFLVGLIFMAKASFLRRPVAFFLVLLGFVYMGSFEWVRESSRRPWIIYDHMYSNSILKVDEEKINEQGVLKTAKWVANREINEHNQLAAGKEIFYLQCSSCHSIGGLNNDILPLTRKFTVFGMDSMLNGLGKLNEYMPRYMGTRQERLALASYIVNDLHGGKQPEVARQQPKDLPFDIPPFDREKDEYVLLAWNNLGMHCLSDSDPWWILLPPANDLFAQLVRRGELPEIVTEGVVLTYEVEQGFENPQKHVTFWEHAQSLLGLKEKLPVKVGVSGNAVPSGQMTLKEGHMAFEASLVPVVPYNDDGTFNPYPIFTITAKDEKTGEVLAQTKMVAPTSTEMGCKNCHGGEWKVGGVAGFTKETSEDILAVHDRRNNTTLLADARAGKPRLCQSCHSDPVLGAKGVEGVMNFPAAVHGWHANFLTDRDETACYRCHPSKATGATGCLRGVHAGLGLTCINCHGTLEDHALSLVKHEHEQGKKSAAKLMTHLTPRTVKSVEEINPRLPWIQEPDCLNCHVDFQVPETIDGFNTWTSGPDELFRLRADNMGIMCEACHGSTHANYPATNIYGKERDNIGPLQYQGNNLPIGSQGSCFVCHIEDMEGDYHHENFDREFRNTELMTVVKK